MKIIPGQTSGVVSQTTASPSQQSARDRAISALMGTAPQVNQNAVQAEEMSAVKAPETLQDDPESTIVEVQGASTEATPESAPKAAEAPADPLSKQYAILARKEKQLRAQIAQQKAALQAEREAIEKMKQPSFDESKYVARDKLTQDPLAVLNELGLSYDEITRLAMTQQQLDPRVQRQIEEQAVQIKELRAAQEQANKSYQEQQQQQYKQAVEQIRQETKQLVTASADFETIRETGSVDDVVELIERTFKAEGRLISVDEAARAVEDYLVEEAIKIAKLKKIQQRLTPSAQGANQSQPQAPKAEQPKQPLKTLTNSVGSTRPLSAKERAVLAFKGEKF